VSDAGVVDENVEVSCRPHCLRDCGSPLHLVGDAKQDRNGRSAVCPDLQGGE
jgi:hypothetical protein